MNNTDIHLSRLGLKRIIALGLTVVGALLLGTLTVVLAQAPAEGEPLPDTLHLGLPPASMKTTLVKTTSVDAAAVYPSLEPPVAPMTLPNPVWRIGVVTDGLYALDAATLAAAGVPVASTDPAHIHLSWRGQPVSLDRSDLDDGTWDAGDALVFYGEKFHGSVQDEKYTDENVYWLSVDADTAPVSMAARSVAPDGASAALGCTVTTRLDENLVYWARHTQNPGTMTNWFWRKISPNVTDTLILPVEAPIAAQGGKLLVEIAPTSSVPRTMRLMLNGTILDTWSWGGKIGRIVTVAVPPGLLLNGNNEVGVFFDDIGTTYLDRIELTYVREPGAVDGTARCRVPETADATYTFTGMAVDAALYDVTDPLNPVRLEGAQASAGQVVFSDDAAEDTRYIAEPLRLAALSQYAPDLTLVDPAEGADALIIAPEHFRKALQPLVAHRTGQGLRVRFVAVEDIYPLFNGGIFHPEAIRGLVAHAYHHWPGEPPQYLFLVGDGHFNLKGYNPATYGAYTPVWIPPYMAFDDPDQGEVPVDARFGDVITETLDNGDTGYLLPEVAVGRIPAQDVAQVEGYVTKLLNYETAPPELWNAQALLVADNGDGYDEGFDGILENLRRQYLDDYLLVDTVYMEDYCSSYSDCPLATHALTEAWNSGAAMLIYAGHGSVNRWAHEPLIFNTDLTALTQTEKLPFLLSMDCWDGNWFFPPSYPSIYDTRSIGEWVTTVLTETGAIAAFSPAALAYAGLEERLAQAMLEVIFDQGERHLGPITQAGRERLGSSYLARTYTLLGDPATRLSIKPVGDWVDLGVRADVTPSLVMAGDVLTYTLAFSNTGELAASESSITFPLSSWLTATAYTYHVNYSGTLTTVPGERYVWNASTITPGGRGMITVTARVKPDLTAFGPLSQVVEIRTETLEANVANNTGQADGGVAFYDVDASPKAQSGGYPRGGRVTYPITIANEGYPETTVVLSATGNLWPTSIEPSSVVVPSLASRIVTATVTIPVTATAGQTDTVSIRALGTGSAAEVELVTEAYHGVYLPLVTR
jgi:uncharacterized repeat protein (TIGR01451 family)